MASEHISTMSIEEYFALEEHNLDARSFSEGYCQRQVTSTDELLLAEERA